MPFFYITQTSMTMDAPERDDGCYLSDIVNRDSKRRRGK